MEDNPAKVLGMSPMRHIGMTLIDCAMANDGMVVDDPCNYDKGEEVGGLAKSQPRSPL